jgi:uncharacterized protein HemX
MNTNGKITVAVVVLIILFLASLGIMGYQIKQKHTTEQALANEMLKSENLLSEKLDLSKQLKSVKDDMLAWPRPPAVRRPWSRALRPTPAARRPSSR